MLVPDKEKESIYMSLIKPCSSCSSLNVCDCLTSRELRSTMNIIRDISQNRMVTHNERIEVLGNIRGAHLVLNALGERYKLAADALEVLLGSEMAKSEAYVKTLASEANKKYLDFKPRAKKKRGRASK